MITVLEKLDVYLNRNRKHEMLSDRRWAKGREQ